MSNFYENLIYSYRLTWFGGAAPCYDNNKLSLAICKRDMRRVIGREYQKIIDKGGSIWIVGLIGNTLKNASEFSNDMYSADQVLYAAKITEIMKYSEYFTSSEHRKDMIYECAEDGKYSSDGKHFKHKENESIHSEERLQDRDWDTKHNTSEKYVLLSEEYFFVDCKLSEKIKNKDYGAIWATGVGHRKFSANADLLQLLQDKANEYKKNRNTEALPKELQNPRNCKGCGKKGGNL